MFQLASVTQVSSGAYEIRLYRNSVLVGHSFLEVSPPGQTEVVGTNHTYGIATSQKEPFTADIPLTSSVPVVGSRIQLLKAGQVVAEKNLSDIPVAVLAVQTNSVQTTERLTTGASYVFHLFLNIANQLVADRDAQFIYDIVSDKFVQPSVGRFPYRGEIISFTGQTAQEFQFDVQPGKLTIKAPYVPDAQKVVFYDGQNQAALTIPVNDGSICNDDDTCNTAGGEDSLNCSNDCKKAVLPAASVTPSPVPAGASSGIVSGLAYTAIGIILLGGMWWFIKRRKAGSSSGALPTPPTPPASNNPV